MGPSFWECGDCNPIDRLRARGLPSPHADRKSCNRVRRRGACGLLVGQTTRGTSSRLIVTGSRTPLLRSIRRSGPQPFLPRPTRSPIHLRHRRSRRSRRSTKSEGISGRRPRCTDSLLDADEPTLVRLIEEALAIEQLSERRAASSILYARYGDLDPSAAVTHAIEHAGALTEEAIRSIFYSWSRVDLEAAEGSRPEHCRVRWRRRQVSRCSAPATIWTRPSDNGWRRISASNSSCR